MFCIAAFIVLLLLAVVSARYRRMLGKAWGCVARRVTFRPCDTTFKQDVKDHLLAPLAIRNPRLVKPASIALEVIAVLIVITTIWSLYIVGRSGLNLWVYGTCNKQDSASCSLGAESCSIDTGTKSFSQLFWSGDVIGAFGAEFSSLGDTISAIPARLQDWDAADYLPQNATFVREYDSAKPTALEVIDPGCKFCRQLMMNILESGFDANNNLSYIAYPITDGESGYKFANSLLATQYLEALRLTPLADAETPGDWQLLEKIFLTDNAVGVDMQAVFNGMTDSDAREQLHTWLVEIGYSPEQIAAIDELAASGQVADIITENRSIVEDDIRTLKIPTIIFDGRRHDGLVFVDDLR